MYLLYKGITGAYSAYNAAANTLGNPFDVRVASGFDYNPTIRVPTVG